MARLIRFANNASSTLASSILSSATTVTVATGEGAEFPTLTAGQFFMATLVSSANIEVVKVTARSGDVMTVVRAQEAVAGVTAAYAFAAGDKIEARLTAEAFGDEIDRIEAATYNVIVDPFTGSGSASFTLSQDPVSKNNTSVYVGGVYQLKSTYTLSGTTLTLGASVSSGDPVEVIYGIPSVIGTPSDGSVTPVKLSTGAPSWNSSGNLSDGIGNVRSIPQNAKTAAYILAASDNGKHIAITTGGVTVNTGIFSIGQSVVIFNNSTASQTITQGTGVTLYNAADGTSGNRTLAARGLATILCVASNIFAITGAGMT